jgi:hypothetical protein
MKKILFTLVILLVVIANGQAQDKLKIGEIKNGKFLVTNPEALKAFFMKSLGNSGTLGKDFQVSTAPEGNRICVYYPVSGNKDKVTNIGVMLVKIKNDAFIVENPSEPSPNGPGGGGSLEIQCIGVSCNICVPNIRWIGGNWMPEVYCECRSGGGGECNMICKIIVHIDI